jgi:N-acetylglucosamine-6-sulfatase
VTRRARFGRLAAIAVAVAFLVAGAAALAEGRAGAGEPAAAAAGKPNIVVLMTDDQTVRDLAVMPGTRRAIGQAGVTFTRDYASYPLCCPSRATLLTGRYAHNHGVRANKPPNGGYGKLDKANTLPVWLQRAGYATTHIGKYLNGYGRDVAADVPPGWTEWHGSVDGSTYLMWGYTLNENGTLHTYGQRTVEDPALYQTDVYRQKAVDFIRRRAGRASPFYLSVAFLAPHAEAGQRRREVSVRSAPRHRGRFASKPLPRPASFDEADVSDKPSFLRATPRLTAQQIRRITRNYRARQEALLAVDQAVEAIVGALRDTGSLQRTYVIFTSDNGFFHGEHRVPQGKYLVHEASSHLPLILRGPGIAGGGRSAELVSNVDLAPTIVAASGAHPTKAMDGRSLLPFARDPGRRSTRPVLHEGLAPSGAGDNDQDGTEPVPSATGSALPGYTAIRTPRFLYVEYFTSRDRELYDLAKDPDELRSLHRDPRYARTRTALGRELARLRRCAGAACRAARPAPPGPAAR